MTISDDAQVGSTLLQVSVSDADSDYNGYVTHWISATEGKFLINPETGDVQLKAALNESERRHYSVTVFARDHGIPAKTTEVPLNIFVDNSNKHEPVFSQFSYYINLLEGSHLNEPLAQFEATDKDEEEAGDVWYRISGGNEDEPFTIDTNSGILGLVKDLDYEKKQFYQVEVTAADRGEPSKSATAILHVTVTDVNDNAPVFPPLPVLLYRPGIVQAGEVIHVFQATDRDSSLNGNNKVNYRLLKGNDR